jgi:hypothetical protein
MGAGLIRYFHRSKDDTGFIVKLDTDADLGRFCDGAVVADEATEITFSVKKFLRRNKVTKAYTEITPEDVVRLGGVL